MHRAEGQVEADEHGPEVDLAAALIEEMTEHLRPPEVNTGKQTEDTAAEDHIVEVRNDVVGVGLLGVGRGE